MNTKYFLFFTYIQIMWCARFINRMDPLPHYYNDQPTYLTLAIQETAIIPFFHSISNIIQFYPKYDNQCTIKEPAQKYKILDEQSLSISQHEIITSILCLKTRNQILTINENFYLSIHQITKKNQLKQIIESRKISNFDFEKINSSPILLADQNQKNIYIISNQAFFHFEIYSYSTNIKNVHKSQVKEIFDAKIFRKHIYTCAGIQGVYIYQISETHSIKIIHNIKQINCMKMHIDKQNELLYAFDSQTGITVYNISQVPNKLITYDHINFQHNKKIRQFKVYQNIILILFDKDARSIVAQYVYNFILKEITFIRYFKFTIYIKEIHLFKKQMIVLGEGTIGLLPLQIHPKLIKNMLDGYFNLCQMHQISMISNGYFIGISRNHIHLAALQNQNHQILHCNLSLKSQLQKIIYKANLTTCNNNQQNKYFQYCQYSKQFLVRKMDIIAPKHIASSLQIFQATLLLVINAGIIILTIMTYRKRWKIKKLEMEFETRKQKQMIPPSSDRVNVISQVIKT